MPRRIERDEVRRLLNTGAQLVEVLPAEEFKEDHLPGAISIPLRHIDPEGVGALDRDRPVIVYCWDTA
jgi:rhodanese-related sulfurtransferase